MLSPDAIETLAARLRDALATGEPCAPLREDGGPEDLGPADAYAIQRRNIEARLARGLDGKPTRIVGRKVGLTSRAVQQWLKVDQPDFGTLLADMEVPDGGIAPITRLLQPRVEGEIAFVLGESLEGPGITARDVLQATAFLLPAIEIIDSRIADWRITFEDTVADNASSGLFVLGTTPVHPEEIPDLRLVGCALRKNGRVVSTGAGVACLDHPAHAVAWLANALATFDTPLQPGDVILSGALGPVTDVEPGDDVRVDIGRLGSVRVRF
ncbi:MAG: hypothetical protein EA398_07665 [Deltaproteobacteria bacterium]|nr:MAG: hypothetical protein EA398_07665 [Deltaproteobacteria bacterium]